MIRLYDNNRANEERKSVCHVRLNDYTASNIEFTQLDLGFFLLYMNATV